MPFSMIQFKNQLFWAGHADRANKMARASLILGISASLFMLIPEYAIFLVLPMAILAIGYGKQAIKNGTCKMRMAAIGKGLGMAVLIVFAIEVMLALLVIILLHDWI